PGSSTRRTIALQVHNSLFSEDLSSLVETTKNEAHHQS
ncbi:hypothetical protein LTSESEN_2516, partial [Salmonella enterica subsp. enterica serovar Senftenberg str. A4-543]